MSSIFLDHLSLLGQKSVNSVSYCCGFLGFIGIMAGYGNGWGRAADDIVTAMPEAIFAKWLKMDSLSVDGRFSFLLRSGRCCIVDSFDMGGVSPSMYFVED